MAVNGAAFAELVARQQPGMTLEQPFYTSPDIFERDVERIVSRQWLFVDHVSALPEPGDFLLYDVAGESIILVRGPDGEVRAFFNVCRHRGSRICLEQKGKVRTLTCPYHAWSWDLEGKLRAARLMGDDFDPEAWPLHRCQLHIWQGLMFINLGRQGDPEQLEFDKIEAELDRYMTPYRLDKTRIVARKTYPTPANWKLAVDNFRECYHCIPAHPEYTMVNEYVRAEESDPEGWYAKVDAWRAVWAEKGFETDSIPPSKSDQRQPFGAYRQPIRDGYKTLTEDGTPGAPLMGELSDFDCGETMVIIGPLFYIYLANDHATLFRFTPVDAKNTDVELVWLVRDDASDEDVDTDKIVWMWDVTTVEDTKIIGDNQKGVDSRRYVPGPYATLEEGSARFTTWYLNRVSS